eukprot:CAMPEP_0116012970 /NCGR_PEP_ID=MMETSP0321-20121206/5441_1 /TAXON_ID=163516 /ORGANISM="Leptocylindrus danicus var. danicus, Strain B650" /LENGTH=100 /DNA_ID=CAMNT_0003482417 /DNA_START=477 /DNA_END=779 /DNA_ORIENTATION=+
MSYPRSIKEEDNVMPNNGNHHTLTGGAASTGDYPAAIGSSSSSLRNAHIPSSLIGLSTNGVGNDNSQLLLGEQWVSGPNNNNHLNHLILDPELLTSSIEG